MNMEKSILRIKNNPIYQELKGYYSQSTIFSALGIERNENRHSAFLCWLLDPKSDHQLGVEPLKKFLALYAVVNEKSDSESLMVNAVNMAGQQIELASDKWDFYPIKYTNNGKCGWGYLKDGNYAIMPKMWRKEDF